jgi:hypothetical protein
MFPALTRRGAMGHSLRMVFTGFDTVPARLTGWDVVTTAFAFLHPTPQETP